MVSNLALILGKSFQGSESPGEASVGQEAGTKPGALTLWRVLGENTCGLIAEPMVLSLVFAVSGWGSAGWGDGGEEVGLGVGVGRFPGVPNLDCTKAASVVAAFPKLQSDLKLYPRVVGQPA